MNKTTFPHEYQRDEHHVHLILYHVIWCPRRRKPILTGAMQAPCQQLMENKCQEQGWHLLTLAIQPDHIHVWVRVRPSYSAADVVNALKGVTSFALRRAFPSITQKLPSLWTRSYFASTAGNVSQETIQRSIDAQKGL